MTAPRARIGVDEWRAGLKLKGQVAARAASQARGDDAEDLIEQLHERPDVAAFATMTRRYARKRGRKYTDPQGPDFGGHLRVRGAPHVECEVKFETEPSFPFRRLRPSQIAQLRSCAEFDGVAVVLVLYGKILPTARWCAVPWGVIDGMMSTGQKSMDRDALLTWEVRAGSNYLAAPWLRPGLAIVGTTPAGQRP